MYEITLKDTIGKIEGFPISIISYIFKNYMKSKIEKLKDIQYDIYAVFVWSNTKEGHSFWKEILLDRNYSLFFDKYPELIDKPKHLPFLVFD